MTYHPKTVLLKNGGACLIRHAEEADAEALLEYLRVISGESRNLAREPEEITFTVEREREILREKYAAEREIMLAAFVDGRLAGNGSFGPVGGQSRMGHRCTIAVALYRAFWGMGIGTALLREILSSARDAGYEQAELEVVSSNEPAIRLYKKLGFEATGTIPRAMKYKDGAYADFLFMVKRLN